VINDQNNRNIIQGETKDFLLGDDIKKEFELQEYIANEYNRLCTESISMLKSNYSVSSSSSKSIDCFSEWISIQNTIKDLTIITGQKPVITKAKKAIAAFKLRAGVNIGVKVTLRGSKMNDFAFKLFNVALPRVRDFRGVKADSFDGRGNYTLGLREQIVFPEIEIDKVDKIFGLGITIVSTAQNDEQGRALLKAFGMPFAK